MYSMAAEAKVRAAPLPERVIIDTDPGIDGRTSSIPLIPFGALMVMVHGVCMQ